ERRPRGADARCPGTARGACPTHRAAPSPEGRIHPVIATTSSGRRFAVLARYLLRGRSGEETERVAWTAGRNLGLDDPELAAVLMQATADENPRVEVPVYHLTINFDPNDPVTPTGDAGRGRPRPAGSRLGRAPGLDGGPPRPGASACAP